jgi:hypothetical protein
VSCALCHRGVETLALNMNDLSRGRQLAEKLGVKWGESAAVCICKLCVAEFELTGEWTVICSACKKGFAKVPPLCDSCGQPTCEDCAAKEIPPGRWEIRHSAVLRAGDRIRICKNCRAERVLTED